MDKQEVLDTIKTKIEDCEREQQSSDQAYYVQEQWECKKVAYIACAKLVEQLDSAKKVKVPAFVADYIELNRSCDVDEIFTSYWVSDNDAVHKWLFDNSNEENNLRHLTAVKAFVEGYEVETEKKYEVVFSKNNKDRYLLMQLNEHIYEIASESDGAGYRSQWFTEQEIKDIDERYWPFAVPVEEVEDEE